MSKLSFHVPGKYAKMRMVLGGGVIGDIKAVGGLIKECSIMAEHAGGLRMAALSRVGAFAGMNVRPSPSI